MGGETETKGKYVLTLIRVSEYSPSGLCPVCGMYTDAFKVEAPKHDPEFINPFVRRPRRWGEYI